MHLSFQVSVHHSGKEDEFMASEIHPWQGVFTVNINIRVRATARATLDKPTAVNYELACREGDRLVNMQSRRSVQSPCNTSVRPPLHLEWQGLTWVSITRTSQATGQGLLGINPKKLLFDSRRNKLSYLLVTPKSEVWPFMLDSFKKCLCLIKITS